MIIILKTDPHFHALGVKKQPLYYEVANVFGYSTYRYGPRIVK
jgi:hypothetical protein